MSVLNMKLLRLPSSASPEKLSLIDSVLRDIIVSEDAVKKADISCLVPITKRIAAPSSSSARDKENTTMMSNDSLFAPMSDSTTNTASPNPNVRVPPPTKIPISFRLQYSDRERELESSLVQYLRLRNRCKATRRSTPLDDTDYSALNVHSQANGSDSNVTLDNEEEGSGVYDWDNDTEVAQIKQIFEMRSFRSKLMLKTSLDGLTDTRQEEW